MTLGWDDIAFGIAIYFIIWWVTIFAVLPFGVRTQDEEDDTVLGTVSSAPSNFRFRRVFVINTLISGLVFCVFCFFTLYLGFSLEDIPRIGPRANT